MSDGPWEDLPDVVLGGPHVKAHNDERHTINDLILDRIETAEIDPAGDLILTKQSGQEMNAGHAVGPESPYIYIGDEEPDPGLYTIWIDTRGLGG